MSSRPRPHRPRPAPPSGSGRVGRPDDTPSLPGLHRQAGVQPIRVPSLLATLRRNATADSAGGVIRGASVGAIAIGATLFVVASLATPVVSANVAKQKAPRPAATTSKAPRPAPSVMPAAPVAPTVPVVALEKKPPAPTKAPADPGAISQLAANGIPTVALNAYRVAAARVNHAAPGCGIDWSLLAGIGRAESDHGRFAGATLRADGTSTPPIVGPALTGAEWEYFPASAEYIAVTGDATYAHALGPMQFIPSTWRGYGADANGDGKADIFNINDAALAAARYLCTAGGDLRGQAGRVKAVLAYNHNDQYLAQVLALADAYKRGVPVSGVPLGNTTGTLPAIGRTGSLPPVNPGAPTASDKDTKDRAKKKATTPTSPQPGKSTKPGSGGTTGGAAGGTGSGGTNAGGTNAGGTNAAGTNAGGTNPGGSGGGSGSSGATGGPTSGQTDSPTSTPPTSSPPTPTKHQCDLVDKLADNLKPADEQVCA